MIPILFWPVLVLTCGYALYRGGVHERAVALVCILATLVSINIHPSIGRYASVATGELADRFWPLWIAGLQLTSSSAHLLKSIEPDLIPHAYAAAVRFWSYPILLVLFIGTWRAHRRRLRQQTLEAASS